MSASSILTAFHNATATVERPATDGSGYTTVASSVAGVLEPVSGKAQAGIYPYTAQPFASEQTHLFYCAAGVNAQADDRITIGGVAYRALPPRDRTFGDMSHKEIPLASYTPGV
jgi:hypothetical protein